MGLIMIDVVMQKIVNLLLSSSPTCQNFDLNLFEIFSEDSYPRLGSMIIDYENPLKKIAEQFVPHQQVDVYSVCLIIFVCKLSVLQVICYNLIHTFFKWIVAAGLDCSSLSSRTLCESKFNWRAGERQKFMRFQMFLTLQTLCCYFLCFYWL